MSSRLDCECLNVKNYTEMQCPSFDKLPFIDFSYKRRKSFSACGKS